MCVCMHDGSIGFAVRILLMSSQCTVVERDVILSAGVVALPSLRISVPLTTPPPASCTVVMVSGAESGDAAAGRLRSVLADVQAEADEQDNLIIRVPAKLANSTKPSDLAKMFVAALDVWDGSLVVLNSSWGPPEGTRLAWPHPEGDVNSDWEQLFERQLISRWAKQLACDLYIHVVWKVLPDGPRSAAYRW